MNAACDVSAEIRVSLASWRCLQLIYQTPTFTVPALRILKLIDSTHKMRTYYRHFCLIVLIFTSTLAAQEPPAQPDGLAKSLGISFPAGAQATVVLERNGKRYSVDPSTKTVTEIVERAEQNSPPLVAGDNVNLHSSAVLFKQKCAVCHAENGQGIKAIGTPDFTNGSLQRSLSDQTIQTVIHNGMGRMPAWGNKLSSTQISSLAAYIRTFTVTSTGTSTSKAAESAPAKSNIYEPGDDVLMSLPTGKPTDKNGIYVNFAHRFAYDPAFTTPGRGDDLLGLDGYAIPSLGVRYGVTDRLSVSAFRSPTVIGRPIQLMAGYNILDEHHDAPFNFMVRVSLEGQDNFRKNFTENIEGIFSKSISGRAQIYAVPTLSFNDRRLTGGSLYIPSVPGVNAFSIGFGLAVDVRPTVALLGEIIPTLLNADELGIHRPAYSFGIQKKIWRHAFTLGLTTSPGVTVSQRAGTRAEFLQQPSADTPGGLFLGFDLTRQIR